jgi:hypothetical protein
METHQKRLTPEEFLLLLREFLAEELKQTQTENRTRKPSYRVLGSAREDRVAGRPNKFQQPVG